MLKLLFRETLKHMVVAVGVDVIQYYMTSKDRALIGYGRCICVGEKNFLDIHNTYLLTHLAAWMPGIDFFSEAL